MVNFFVARKQVFDVEKRRGEPAFVASLNFAVRRGRLNRPLLSRLLDQAPRWIPAIINRRKAIRKR